jgi:hypothetical protein
MKFPRAFSAGLAAWLLTSCAAASIIPPSSGTDSSIDHIIDEEIREGTRYLLRMIDPVHGGAHKYYYADRDAFEERLHTIYTASLIYTLLGVQT